MFVAIPLVVFAVVSVVLWQAFGVRNANDTGFFLSGAETLRAGHWPHDSQASYLGYIAFVAIFQVLGLSAGWIVFAQWLISASVVVAIFDLGRRVASPTAGSIAATMYALNVDVTRFTFYVLSDSLFASVLLLTLYAVYRAAADSRPWFAAAIGGCLAVALIRTNGWLMLPVLVEWLIRSRPNTPTNRWRVRLAFGICYLVCVAAGFSRVGAGNVGYELLRSGRVIWLDPESWITMPDAGELQSGLPPAVAYALSHPLASLDLMSRRVIVEVTHTRRFYSRAHNTIAGVTVWCLYVLAAIGCWLHRHSTISVVTILLVGVQLGIVAMTAADWDGRFIIAVLPLVTVWSGIGLAWLLSAAAGPTGRGLHHAGTI